MKDDDKKQWFHDVTQLSRSEFEAVISAIPLEKLTAKGAVNRWSAKDVIAHLTFWLEVFAQNTAARIEGRTLIDTRDYESLNRSAWRERSNASWAGVKHALDDSLDAVKDHVEMLTADQLTNPGAFTLTGKPFVKDFLYELIDHPLHHWVILYEKQSAQGDAIKMLARVESVLRRRGFGRWTSSSRKKIQSYEAELVNAG